MLCGVSPVRRVRIPLQIEVRSGVAAELCLCGVVRFVDGSWPLLVDGGAGVDGWVCACVGGVTIVGIAGVVGVCTYVGVCIWWCWASGDLFEPFLMAAVTSAFRAKSRNGVLLVSSDSMMFSDCWFMVLQIKQIYNSLLVLFVIYKMMRHNHRGRKKERARQKKKQHCVAR